MSNKKWLVAMEGKHHDKKPRYSRKSRAFKKQFKEMLLWIEPDDFKVAPDLHEESLIEEMSRYELNQILDDERVP